MKKIIDKVLPSKIDNSYSGYKIAYIVFSIITAISFIRSCIHVISPDGGASSIAGMNIDLPGGDGIVFAFALWGSSQLLFAFIQILVCIRYKSLVPLMYIFLILETLMRIGIGTFKPVEFSHVPPGATGNHIMLPLAIVMLVLSLIDRDKVKGE